MSTCWHGKEGFCEVCYLIIGDGHLRAVERNGKNSEPKSSGDNETEGTGQDT